VVVLSNPSGDRVVVLSPPGLRLKLPWDASCSFGAGIPLSPPQHGVALSGCCSSGDAQVAAHSSLYAEHHKKVVNSVKMKPAEVAILGLLSFGVVLHRIWWFTLQAAQHFRGSSPSSKALCRLSRKMKGCLL
jgi:hypothetical protein